MLARGHGESQRRGSLDDAGEPWAWAALACALFVLPVAVHGFSRWSPRPGLEPGPELTPGLVAAIRERVPERAVVYSDPQTSYRIAAYAPVYVAVAPVPHVANTRANRPYARRRQAQEFFRTGRLEIPRRAGASWLVLDRARSKLKLPLAPVYRDERFVLYRL